MYFILLLICSIATVPPITSPPWEGRGEGEVKVKERWITISFYTTKTKIEKPYKVIFVISASKGPSGSYNGVIAIFAPNGKVFTKEFSIDYEGGIQEYNIEWNAPSNAVPGTYLALLSVYNKYDSLVAEKACMFYLSDPDMSYIEVLGSKYGKIVHIHLQRFRIEYRSPIGPEMEYDFLIDPILLIKAFALDVIGFVKDIVEDIIYPQYKSAKRGLVSPTEPYDLTVFLFPKEIFGHYAGFAYETYPLGIVEKTTKEIAEIIIISCIKKIISLPSLPLPTPLLEKLRVISKDTYESLKVNTYKVLLFPTEIKTEYLTSKFSYKLGQTIGFYVRLTDPRNNKPIKDPTIRVFIGPLQGEVTSTQLIPFMEYLGDGVYRVEIPPSAIKSIMSTYHVNSYVIYFFSVAPGYIGISPGKVVNIASEQSFGDISGLVFLVNPKSVSFSDRVVINISFCATAYSLNGRVDVKVKVIKKTFFGLLTTTIVEKQASLGKNNMTIEIRGDQIADYFLWWPIAGSYSIKLVVTLTYYPYKLTTVESIEESTFYITINVHD